MALDDPEYAACVELLRSARAERGVTQTDLATKLGKPQSFVSKYENLERYLNVAEFIRIARALELPLSDALQSLGWK